MFSPSQVGGLIHACQTTMAQNLNIAKRTVHATHPRHGAGLIGANKRREASLGSRFRCLLWMTMGPDFRATVALQIMRRARLPGGAMRAGQPVG